MSHQFMRRLQCTDVQLRAVAAAAWLQVHQRAE
jgi:hypothetical protein